MLLRKVGLQILQTASLTLRKHQAEAAFHLDCENCQGTPQESTRNANGPTSLTPSCTLAPCDKQLDESDVVQLYMPTGGVRMSQGGLSPPSSGETASHFDAPWT